MSYFVEAIRNKYADFGGRARRAEYWWFTLFYLLAAVAVFAVDFVIGANFILYALFILATFVPSLGVLVRRLHDTDRSGWWYFVSWVPLVGGFILLAFLLMDGTPGPNRYGPSPKGNPNFADPMPAA